MKALSTLYSALLLIDRINEVPYQALPDLSDYLNRQNLSRIFTPQNIKRYIKNIRDSWQIPIEYNRYYKGYYIPGCSRKDDVLRLAEALHIFYASGCLPHVVFPEKQTDLRTRCLPALAKAIKNRNEIKFDYHCFSRQNYEAKTIEPVALKENCTHWYLLGRYAKENNIRSFALERIRSLHTTGRIFKTKTQENIERMYADSYGLFTGEQYPIKNMILAFDSFTGKYLKVKPIHPSQTILQDTPEQFVIRLKVRVTPDLISELIRYGNTIRVLYPSTLRYQLSGIFASGMMRNRI